MVTATARAKSVLAARQSRPDAVTAGAVSGLRSLQMHGHGYIYIYIYTHTYTHIHTYIYIYRERERESDICIYRDVVYMCKIDRSIDRHHYKYMCYIDV